MKQRKIQTTRNGIPNFSEKKSLNITTRHDIYIVKYLYSCTKTTIQMRKKKKEKKKRSEMNWLVLLLQPHQTTQRQRCGLAFRQKAFIFPVNSFDIMTFHSAFIRLFILWFQFWRLKFMRSASEIYRCFNRIQ